MAQPGRQHPPAANKPVDQVPSGVAADVQSSTTATAEPSKPATTVTEVHENNEQSEPAPVYTVPQQADRFFLRMAEDVLTERKNMADVKRELVVWFNTLGDVQRLEHALAIKARAERLRIFSEALHQEVSFVSGQPTV